MCQGGDDPTPARQRAQPTDDPGHAQNTQSGQIGEALHTVAGEGDHPPAALVGQTGEIGAEEVFGDWRDHRADRRHGGLTILAVPPVGGVGPPDGEDTTMRAVPMTDAPVNVIVLPTYNEADNLPEVLRRIRHAAPDVGVLVVDDASPDGTGVLAERLGEELGGIRVLHRTAKEGLGTAYRAGFAQVLGEGAEVVVSMDADLSHDPAALPAMLTALADGADMVIGSRYVPGGAVVNWPVHRRLLSRWGNRYTAWALGLRVGDCTSGYRVYRGDALRAIEVGATTAEGYAFLTELARRMAAVDLQVREIPIVFVDRSRGRSKMSWRIVVESMWLVTRWAVADRRSRRRPTPEPTRVSR